jgi:hypothetical protein
VNERAEIEDLFRRVNERAVRECQADPLGRGHFLLRAAIALANAAEAVKRYEDAADASPV